MSKKCYVVREIFGKYECMCQDCHLKSLSFTKEEKDMVKNPHRYIRKKRVRAWWEPIPNLLMYAGLLSVIVLAGTPYDMLAMYFATFGIITWGIKEIVLFWAK